MNTAGTGGICLKVTIQLFLCPKISEAAATFICKDIHPYSCVENDDTQEPRCFT